MILKDALGYRIDEVATMLETTETSVKGALQRARATLRSRLGSIAPEQVGQSSSEQERVAATRFADAYGRNDIAGVIALLTNDAKLTMPPYPNSYQGRAAIARFLQASFEWRGAKRLQLVPTRANTQPAFAGYLQVPSGETSHSAGLFVLSLAGERIHAVTRFMDAKLFGYFALPPSLGRPTNRPASPSQNGESHRSTE